MLNKVKFKLTYAQISEFILAEEYTNFLTLPWSAVNIVSKIDVNVLWSSKYSSLTPLWNKYPFALIPCFLHSTFGFKPK